MKLYDIDIEANKLDESFFSIEVPALARNFHAYSCEDIDEARFSYGISYLADSIHKELVTKIVKFQFASFDQEINNNSIFIGTFSRYAIHVFLIV